jgi:hypothetical protein
MATITVGFPGQVFTVTTDITGTSGTVASDVFYFPKSAKYYITLWDYYTISTGALNIDAAAQVCFENTAAKFVTIPAATGFSLTGVLRDDYSTASTWGIPGSNNAAYHCAPIFAPYFRVLYTKNAGNTGLAHTAYLSVYVTREPIDSFRP